TIMVTLGSATATTSLTVTNATITSVLVSPANVSIPTGGLQNFTATGVFSDSTTQNITILVSWSSDKTVIATVGNAPNSGFATGVSAGTANISATFTFAGNTKTGTIPLTVSSASL